MAFVDDVKAMFNSIQLSETTGGIANFNASLPIVGNVTVIDFRYLNEHSSFIRGLGSAFIYLFMGIYLIKEAPKVLGSMT